MTILRSVMRFTAKINPLLTLMQVLKQTRNQFFCIVVVVIIYKNCDCGMNIIATLQRRQDGGWQYYISLKHY